MSNFVQEIYDFNQQAGLLEKGYNDFLESSFQIEEALEGFDLRKLWCKLNGFNSEITATVLQVDELKTALKAKDIARKILYDHVTVDDSLESLQADYISDVDRLDKAIDAIVFAVGSIAKLGLTPKQISKAISVVTNANLQKLSMPKDEHGKLTKPADFVGPEVELQKILDERQ